MFSILLIYMGYNLFFPSIDVSHLSSCHACHHPSLGPEKGTLSGNSLEGPEVCSFPDMLDAEKISFDIPLDPAATKYAPTFPLRLS